VAINLRVELTARESVAQFAKAADEMWWADIA